VNESAKSKAQSAKRKVQSAKCEEQSAKMKSTVGLLLRTLLFALCTLYSAFGELALAGPLTVTVSPALPTVGDLIHLHFPLENGESVRLSASPDYEILSVVGNVATIRAFKPGAFRVAGAIVTPAGIHSFQNLEVRITSVLAPGDSLEPAPLKPPITAAPPAIALPLIACSLVAALIAWTLLVLVSRRRRLDEDEEPAAPSLEPAQELRQALGEIAALEPRIAAAKLAGATRRYLSRIDPSYGRELTSRELLRVMEHTAARSAVDLVADILRQGDLAKFSLWSPDMAIIRDLAGRALELPGLFEVEAAA